MVRRWSLVPAGEAIVGSNSGPQYWGPQVRLSLDPFYIAEKEVTVARYMLCRQKAGVVGKKMEPPLNVDGLSDQPAVGVTWGEARLYAQWIGGSLPTEAQWEKAARGPQGFKSPWGNSRPLWRVERTLEQIDPVGRHPDDRSIYGAIDMAGNAREWVADFFREDSFQSLQEMSSDRRRNYAGPRNSPTNQRVVKGNGPGWTVHNREGRTDERASRPDRFSLCCESAFRESGQLSLVFRQVRIFGLGSIVARLSPPRLHGRDRRATDWPS